MNKRRLVVSFVLLVWFIIDIMNFIVSIFLYKNNHRVYPIIFWSLYCLEKLVVITITLAQRLKTSLRLALLDTISLGFFSSFFDHSIQINKIDALMIVKVINRAAISILQLIFFFGLGIFKDGDDYPIINLAYASYVLYLTMRGIIFEVVQYQGGHQIVQKVFQSVLITLTYQSTLSSMVTIKDNNDINLGYYFILITGLQQVILFCKANVKEVNIFKIISTNIFFNTPGFHQVVHVKKWFVIVNYLAQLARFILAAVFMNEILSSQNSHLNNINNVFTIIINILYLGYFLKKVFKKIFLVDIIHIGDIKDFESIYYKLKNNKFYWFQKVHIFFDRDISGEVTRSNNCTPVKGTSLCQSQLCEEYYQFNEMIANKESENIKFVVQGFNQVYCEYHLQKSLINIKKVNHWIFFQLYKYLNHNSIFPILLDRYLNGHIHNSSNPNLFNHLQSTQEKLVFLQLEQEILQMNAFRKNLVDQLLNQPELILYDLYSN